MEKLRTKENSVLNSPTHGLLSYKNQAFTAVLTFFHILLAFLYFCNYPVYLLCLLSIFPTPKDSQMWLSCSLQRPTSNHCLVHLLIFSFIHFVNEYQSPILHQKIVVYRQELWLWPHGVYLVERKRESKGGNK